MTAPVETTDDVIAVIVKTLGIDERRADLTGETPLFGAMPELDSLAVLDLIVALEDHFGITIDDELVTGDAFSTVGHLSELVDDLRNGKNA